MIHVHQGGKTEVHIGFTMDSLVTNICTNSTTIIDNRTNKQDSLIALKPSSRSPDISEAIELKISFPES